MPDGTHVHDDLLDHCARAMTSITREWAALEASGPRTGPVREAITKLEPAVHAQMVLALVQWTSVRGEKGGPAFAKLSNLASQITAPHHPAENDPDSEPPPHLTAIDFVQLWPSVLKELREAQE